MLLGYLLVVESYLKLHCVREALKYAMLYLWTGLCAEELSGTEGVYMHLVQKSLHVFVYQVSPQGRERDFTEVSDNHLVYWTLSLKYL